MNKIKINYEGNYIEFGLNKYKVLLGDNVLVKFKIKQSLLSYFNKEKFSENMVENQINFNVFLNDRIISVRDTMFYNINSSFSLKEDIKLGSKSMLNKYVELSLNKIEYNDILMTINTLINSLNDELFEEEINMSINNKVISFFLEELNAKKIIKLMDVSLSNKEFSINPYEFNYYELILLQLKIANKIAIKSNMRILIYLEIKELNKNLIEYINSLDSNVLVIIELEKIIIKENINNICIINDLNYDLANDNLIYNDIIKVLPYHTELEEFKENIKNLLISDKDKVFTLFK